jgi:hypothetical protein
VRAQAVGRTEFHFGTVAAGHRRAPERKGKGWASLVGGRLRQGYGQRSTIITSQLPPSKWHEYIGDPTVADAILDRLLGDAHRIVLKGPSRDCPVALGHRSLRIPAIARSASG